jgi:hypothetical protein
MPKRKKVKQYKHKSAGAKARQASRVRQDYYEKAAKRGQPIQAGIKTEAAQSKVYKEKAMAEGNMRATLRREQQKTLAARRKARKKR